MTGIKWNFLCLAILAAFSIVGMGISLGVQSMLGMLICLIILVSVMGYGFKMKKKLREAGRL
ncbi:YlaF family protein [Siminovitchia sp. FSL H7-0308]|uniref:High-affinity Fe2+/Pb2+ permease n=1 Tax=Siminovitchia thermophila TaxID=1245522 RepID=A0ABS2RAS5_9BACI|nr:YlaF family protein [Siminovitchia thermophila]MBM7716762.1 high-affinity Fe2+/Pb2+ permease [Siminovitchia thermophila]ONK23710.1 hypothetical protein BLX87_09090 [Bacillus sp. VT-16-64]